ncbi:Lactoylglutathione lyase [Dispira simplex]|nr:Lactoylglutathione lyase [Dispira simplex]
MFRVKDPEASIKFYTEVLGMTLLHKMEQSAAKFTLYFLGYTHKQEGSDDISGKEEGLNASVFKREGVLELTHNWGTESDPEFKGYHNGNSDPQGFGHIAITVDNIEAACERFEAMDVQFKKRLQDGSMKHIAFILDPDGYWVEILSRPQA